MVKHKIRMIAGALALVLCISTYTAPKAEAVAAEATAVAIGVAVLASYVAATQLRFTGDVADTISNGISSLVSDWVEASAVAASADDWLANLGNATQMTSPGMLQLQGAFARGCAQFVEWLTETFGLDEEGSDVPVYEAPAFAFADGSPVLLFDQSLGNYSDASFFDAGTVYALSNGTTVEFVFKNSGYLDFSIIDSSGSFTSGRAGGSLWSKYTFDGGALADAGSGSVYVYVHWFDSASSKSGWLTDSKKYSLGAISSGEVSVVREEGFANPAVDAADDDSITISTGLTSPTLSDFAYDAPAQIAAGEFAPTVELTQAGADPDVQPDDDEEVGIYFPALSGIQDKLSGLGDSIVDGIMSGLKSLFVPKEGFFAEAIPELQATFQGRMGLLTFPISLLIDFLGRLLDLSEQEPILRWNSVSIYGTELIAAGQYNFKDALKSDPFKQIYDIYMVVANAILIFAFLSLCYDKYRKIMQN